MHGNTNATKFATKRVMKKLLFILTLIATTATAQEISYGEYMQRVSNGNIALAAKRLDIEIADAGVKSSEVRNDPTLALTYSNNEDWSKGLGQGIELELSRSFTFGVRRSRMDLAESVRKETVAMFEEYMRNFRADATIAYLEQLRAEMMFEETVKICIEISEVAANDSVRFMKGEIAEGDWLESRMAQGIALNAVLEAEAEVDRCAIKLGYYMGNLDRAEKLRATGTLEISEEVAPLDSYIATALENRADLVVALSRVATAEAMQKFNSATRRPELDVVVGATYNISDPDFMTIKAGVAVPLKFSNLNKGARIMDEISVKQANMNVEEARLLIQADVMQAYSDFIYAERQSRTFSDKMLDDMNKVVKGKIKAYEVGETPFIEFLIAERNRNEMKKEYIDALFSKAAAWVELQRSVGIDLEFGTKTITE